ncbi:MAG: helix-turn-helix domain-containing protein [Deltaproteobacteria bacterium]|nr:helix-turn-helix domain-containing protein [Deltaproteobacteria bacterium]
MEKISIVKRRKRGSFEPEKGQPPEAEGRPLPVQELTEIPAHVLRQGTDNVDEPEDLSDENEPAISIKLTPEQYNLVKSSQYVNYFLNGESSGVSLDMQQRPDGQIVFNFQFKKVDTVKMLKSEHVCQMLQISKSLLMTLVKSQKIRSYKIGRLRRFLFEDILDYLSKSEEIFINSKA